MKILLCNKFYYRRGGDCIYTLNLEQILKVHGHEVAIFAMQYPKNESSEWSKYWPKNMSKMDVLTRPFGSKAVADCFTRLIKDFRPDVVHLNNIHTQLSPIIAKIAHEHGIRVVWTLHDTKLVCPCYTCMRNKKWCTECFADKKAVIRHKCVHGSLPQSIIGYLEAKKWNKEKLQEYTDSFIAPSQFMMDTVIKGGYMTDKFQVLCNFIDLEKVKNPCFEKQDYYVYLGRVDDYKGVRTLCEAAAVLPYKLIVIGGGELLGELQEKYALNGNVEFKGQMLWNDFRLILEQARFMVLPSECSENNPLTVIEAQCLGTPVLGARIGGIPELIKAEENGKTFESGNVEDLADKIKWMFEATFDYKKIAENAVCKYSDEAYYEKLMGYYQGSGSPL